MLFYNVIQSDVWLQLLITGSDRQNVRITDRQPHVVQSVEYPPACSGATQENTHDDLEGICCAITNKQKDANDHNSNLNIFPGELDGLP